MTSLAPQLQSHEEWLALNLGKSSISKLFIGNKELDLPCHQAPLWGSKWTVTYEKEQNTGDILNPHPTDSPFPRVPNITHDGLRQEAKPGGRRTSIGFKVATKSYFSFTVREGRGTPIDAIFVILPTCFPVRDHRYSSGCFQRQLAVLRNTLKMHLSRKHRFLKDWGSNHKSCVFFSIAEIFYTISTAH